MYFLSDENLPAPDGLTLYAFALVIGGKYGTLTTGRFLRCLCREESYPLFEVAVVFVLAVAALFLARPAEVRL